MLFALAICVVAQNPAIAADYFPLGQGTKWTYSREVNGARMEFTQAVGPDQKIGGDIATPIQPQIPGAMPVYYVVKDQAVYVAAYDYKVPLLPMRQVLSAAATPQKWIWEGLEQTLYIHMDGESTPLGPRKVLGQDRDAIQVRIVAQVSGTRGKWTETQTAYYAKGIGLYAMEDQSSGEGKTKITLTLTAFEPGRSVKQ